MRKLLDSRINGLIKRICEDGHRGMFVIIGDNAKKHVVTLHHLLSKSRNGPCSNILWCYKKQLELSSNPKKRKRQMRKKTKMAKLIKENLKSAETQGERGMESLDSFMRSNSITYALYKDSTRLLGCTFDVCVLQDFEAVTPNLLAQTVETVSGGGLIIILLQKMSSLRQLSNMASDFYRRLRREDNKDGIVCRFNERFTLSLACCENCLVVDEEMNLLPLTAGNKPPITRTDLINEIKSSQEELELLKDELKDSKPLNQFLELCKTLDQAKAFLCFVDVALDRESAVLSLTAARGRGKTFVCGLFVAYSLVVSKTTNTYVTSPYPQSLKPLFEAIKLALQTVGFKEHSDFEMVYSRNPNHGKAAVRLNVFKNHSQFVQYVDPSEHKVLSKSQAQLLIVDEAAAIPLPVTKSLLKQNGVCVLSSTTSGYEGTGRSLTLKLLKSLREMSTESSASGVKKLRETTLQQPIRYSAGDAVERWLGELLCLQEAPSEAFSGRIPALEDCRLLLVDRDALFSGHEASEAFLKRVMAICVASHYRNSPNDLQLLADAPEHRLFVLTEGKEALPEVIAVVQVAFEGRLSDDMVQRGFLERIQAAGDLIPWTLSKQYQEKSFACFLGVRVVRISTHPALHGMGYGSHALKLLIDCFQKNTDEKTFDENKKEKTKIGKTKSKIIQTNATYQGNDLLDEIVRPRSNIPPLLNPVDTLFFGNLEWIGVSFGLTQALYNFWAKAGFRVVYLRLSSNKLTGEYSCIMLKSLFERKNKIAALETKAKKMIKEFQKEFALRFVSLLSFGFRAFPVPLALSLLHHNVKNDSNSPNRLIVNPSSDAKNLESRLSEKDKKRIAACASNLVDLSTILDLIPLLAELLFCGHFSNVSMSLVQKAIYVAVGLQRRSIDSLAKELDIPSSQLVGLFNKSLRKISKTLQVDKSSV